MHIKNIYCMIEKLTEKAKCEFDKGIEKVDAHEMSKVTDMIKDLCEAEYYAKISVAMDEAEYGEDYDYMGAYERRGYRGQPRDSKGRYMSRRNYQMTPEMHNRYPAEYYRDMDKEQGRMYYTDGGTSMGGNMNGNSSRMNSEMGRDRREGRSGQSRRNYMESKEMNKDKSEKMKNLEEYMKELSTDVTEMIQDASQEEKMMLKNKMQVLMQKF